MKGFTAIEWLDIRKDVKKVIQKARWDGFWLKKKQQKNRTTKIQKVVLEKLASIIKRPGKPMEKWKMQH